MTENKSEASSLSKDSIHSKPKSKTKSIIQKSKPSVSDRGISESETERDKNVYSDTEQLDNADNFKTEEKEER
jgi:hypothetical protein